MKNILSIALLCLQIFPALATDARIKIGGTPFTIPAPSGYAPVTPDMESMNRLFGAMIPPMNSRLAEFIPQEDVGAAKSGQMIMLGRYFGVQTLSKMADTTTTKAQFAAMTSMIRKQNQTLMDRVEKQTPGTLAKINQNLEKAFDVDPGLKSMKMVPFPPHDQSERSLAFSMMVNYGVDDGAGGTKSSLTAATATVLHLKGKLLFLYCYGNERDLTWTKQVSKEWAAAVLKANPSDPQIAKLENESGRGLNWLVIGRKAGIGSAIGLAVALLGFFLQRRDAASDA